MFEVIEASLRCRQTSVVGHHTQAFTEPSAIPSQSATRPMATLRTMLAEATSTSRRFSRNIVSRPNAENVVNPPSTPCKEQEAGIGRENVVLLGKPRQ